MKITLIEVPYDSGHYGRRMGRGPLHLVQAGVAGQLERRGHEVRVIGVRLGDGFLAEVGAAVETQRLVAECVADEREKGRFPLVLSGNCATCVGTLAGIGCTDTAVVWLDSHGDLNTPETSESGFFDGMALAMLTGDCWRGVAATVPGFAPVPHRHVALVGARDLDRAETAFMERSGIPLIDVAAVHRQGARRVLAEVLDPMAPAVDGIYFHLDLDVLDPRVAYVNQYQAPDGLEVAEVEEIIRAATARLPLKAAAVTAYDAGHDPDDGGAEAALRLIDCLVEAAADGGSKRA